jgi:hypothetical protein|uniref:Uncharacterized protein n=1 Tax=Siphoviridae sp. ctEkS11 TaxID=2827272 RepID=A0A8S5R3K7_9CAUD|nr:MAG TPA: hypothetical protein [Siphoviridae sp. ctEkS11]
MKLNVKKIIEDNIITVDISVASLGTSTSTVDEEKSLLADFPRSVRFSDINFKANVKLDENGDPIVTDEEANNSTIVSVELKKIINKEYPINDEMNIVMPFDVTKIATTETNTLLDTVEKVGKAYATVFATKVQAEIAKKLAEVRSLNTKFEGETEVIL